MSQLACDFFDDVSLHAELRRLKETRSRPAPVDVERQLLEERFLQRARAEVASVAGRAPSDAAQFVSWFARLAQDGPGQRDPLFPWLEHEATLDQFHWFLRQEVATEAGFEELARLELDLSIEPVPEAIALANLLAGLACNGRYGFHAGGALGVVELTAPGRAACVNRALSRLGIPAGVCAARPSKPWREVIAPLVAENPTCRFAIAEGALMLLTASARCFEKYRLLLGVPR